MNRVQYKTNSVRNTHNPYYEARAVIGSPLQYGWKEGKFGLEPVLFEGQMSSDFLQDLVCTYAKGNQCAVGVVFYDFQTSVSFYFSEKKSF
jgi:hypothetical protein